jgi:hypothetical protein
MKDAQGEGKAQVLGSVPRSEMCLLCVCQVFVPHGRGELFCVSPGQ